MVDAFRRTLDSNGFDSADFGDHIEIKDLNSGDMVAKVSVDDPLEYTIIASAYSGDIEDMIWLSNAIQSFSSKVGVKDDN